MLNDQVPVQIPKACIVYVVEKFLLQLFNQTKLYLLAETPLK